MRATECVREVELLDALQTSSWPECCSSELRTHVEACSSCSTLAAIVLPLLDEHRTAVAEAHPPSSGMVWWRAQMRARREAARAANQPMFVVQGIAVAGLLGLVAGLMGMAWPAFGAALAWIAGIGDAIGLPALSLARLEALGPSVIVPIVAVVLSLVLVPIAVYLTAAD